jgi:GT2 family glycosyltransferase
LNSDTEVEARTLPRLFAAFDSDPRLGAAGAVLLNPGGSSQWSGGPQPTLLWLFLLTSGLGSALGRLPGYRRLRPLDAETRPRVDWVTGAAMAIRHGAWEAVGPMDTGYRFYAQDLDFCLRLRDAGWHVAIAPGFRVMHLGGATIGRRSGASGSAHPGLLWADLLTWAEKRHGGGPDLAGGCDPGAGYARWQPGSFPTNREPSDREAASRRAPGLDRAL